MADKSVAEKLLIKPGYRVLMLNAPKGYGAALGSPLPRDVKVSTAAAGGPVDLIVLFVTTSAELEARLPGIKGLLKPNGLLWVAYRKGKGEPNRDTIRAHAATVGWQAVALVSADETWSALRLKAV